MDSSNIFFCDSEIENCCNHATEWHCAPRNATRSSVLSCVSPEGLNARCRLCDWDMQYCYMHRVKWRRKSSWSSSKMHVCDVTDPGMDLTVEIRHQQVTPDSKSRSTSNKSCSLSHFPTKARYTLPVFTGRAHGSVYQALVWLWHDWITVETELKLGTHWP